MDPKSVSLSVSEYRICPPFPSWGPPFYGPVREKLRRSETQDTIQKGPERYNKGDFIKVVSELREL